MVVPLLMLLALLLVLVLVLVLAHPIGGKYHMKS
jgi:hypothetical protein